MVTKIEIQQLPDFPSESSELVKVLDNIRYKINKTDKTGELFEFYWFAREYPRLYRFHYDHLEHRLKSIHKNYRLIADDMEKLLKYCANYDKDFTQFLTECRLLNEYIEEGRYPGDLPWEMIGENDAEEAIEADNIANFVTQKIKLE